MTTTYTDTQRLDFVAAHSAWVSHSSDGEVCNLWHRDDDGKPRPMQGYPQRCYNDHRQAIDACLHEWETRLSEIAAGRLHPSKEIKRFADAKHPRGAI